MNIINFPTSEGRISEGALYVHTYPLFFLVFDRKQLQVQHKLFFLLLKTREFLLVRRHLPHECLVVLGGAGERARVVDGQSVRNGGGTVLGGQRSKVS